TGRQRGIAVSQADVDVEDARVVGGVVEVAAGVTVEAAHLLARLGMRRIEGRIVEPEARSRELRLAVERGIASARYRAGRWAGGAGDGGEHDGTESDGQDDARHTHGPPRAQVRFQCGRVTALLPNDARKRRAAPAHLSVESLAGSVSVAPARPHRSLARCARSR